MDLESELRVADDLQTFGLIELTTYIGDHLAVIRGSSEMRQVTKYHRAFTKKMDRFRYWIGVNGRTLPPATPQPKPGFDWQALDIFEEKVDGSS